MSGMFAEQDLINYVLFQPHNKESNLRFSKQTQIILAPESLLGTSLIGYPPDITDIVFDYKVIFAEITPSRFLNLSPDYFYDPEEFQQECESLIDYVEKISVEQSLDLLENPLFWDLLENENPTYADLYHVVMQTFTSVTTLGVEHCPLYFNLVMGFDGIINPTAGSTCHFDPFQVLSFDKDYIDILETFMPHSENVFKTIDELI